MHVLQCLSFGYSVNSEREYMLLDFHWYGYNSEHKPLCLSNSTVMISSQKCLTRSQNKALQCVSLKKIHKITCTQLYRIVTYNRRFPDRNCSHARILMEFKGLIPLLSLKFQRLKKNAPSDETGLYLPDSHFAPLCIYGCNRRRSTPF